MIKTKSEELDTLTAQVKAAESHEQEAKEGLALLDARKKVNSERIAELSRQLTLKDRAYRSYADELENKDLLYMRRAELEEQLGTVQETVAKKKR